MLNVPLRFAQLPAQPPAPATGFTGLYASTGGQLRVRHATGSDPLTFTSKSLGADVAGAVFSGGGAAVTGLDVPVVAGTYTFRYVCGYTASTTSISARVQLTGPTTDFTVMRVHLWPSATNDKNIAMTGLGVWSDAITGSGGATVLPLTLYGQVTFNAAGTLGLKIGANTTGTVTIKAGSFLVMGRAW